MLLKSQVLKTGSRSLSTAVPPRKVGAFRGGVTGFLLGVTLTGVGSYYYLLDQYKNANTVLIADIAVLQNSINNLEKHVRKLEENRK